MTLSLTQFRAALAGVATAPVHVLEVGDSVTEDTGASVVANGYAQKLVGLLQAAYNPTGNGGAGFVNTAYYSPVTPPWVFSGGGTIHTGYLGNRSRSFAINETATLTFTGTSASFHFIKGTAFATSGQFTPTIDGTPQSVVTPGGNPQNLRGVWTTPVMAHGTHTVLLTPPAGGQLFTLGAHIFDGDETSGVHGWEAGHYGTTSSAYDTTSLTDYCAMYNPALVTIFLGLNDETSNTTAVTYSTNIQARIAEIRALCAGTPSILLIAPYVRVDGTGPQDALVPQYASALAALAAGDANIDFYDLSAHFNAKTMPANMSDIVHPNDTGHALIASLIAEQITGTPPDPGWQTVIAERWNGAAWAPVIAEKWNGTAWAPSMLERAT